MLITPCKIYSHNSTEEFNSKVLHDSILEDNGKGHHIQYRI